MKPLCKFQLKGNQLCQVLALVLKKKGPEAGCNLCFAASQARMPTCSRESCPQPASWCQEITGLTDETKPKRLGPKRASKIRKLMELSKEARMHI